ncbi:helicase-related protein [Catellatospora chokoriensis]|uniref:Helicase n=1 Tax=Catellatospora chokoriensis TaxID=310353 RepID=A0A8J3NSY6_9ACTN|nr:helicase-related protein [Catellatospora chokoriensis]GIF91510.1 helicase [Catellatospora chokoriensis]
METKQTAAYAPGARILVRDEEWLVRAVKRGTVDGDMIKAVGVSEFVRDMEATFFSELDRDITVMDPEATRLVQDRSSRFQRGRLFLEAVLRRTPLPQSERGLALADSFLLDANVYQQRPAELALQGLRPRILLADVVGLGKTLEIGLTLAELIRRGRGERILVVTPQQVLEQFQREMWTRFAIPLVRLDSTGIQRIQQEIPAGRNPFLYFKRVIISVDTLKDAGQFGHHLDNTDWDAVVIDESHNLINRGSKRNELARRLARRSDALLLASATPHNGERESFAELIRLLDPAAIADVKDYSAEDISHLYLRRTKNSPEVRDHTRGLWADRGPTVTVHCAAGPIEEQIFAELAQTWLAGKWREEPTRGQDRLFPYTLLKSFLSSHLALAATVAARLKDASDPTEQQALRRLADLAGSMTDRDSAKLTALVAQLREIGIAAGSRTRAVVFSERVPTLKWLEKVMPGLLGLKPDAVRVMHGGLSDTEQQSIVEEFELAGSPVRLLVTGDIASEGVNLHRECHHLIHYDIPWSLIRIEQRNGRVDRYGQEHPPQFRALILTSQTPDAKDDRTVAEKLLEKEEQAHRSLGSVTASTGVHDPKAEEDRLVKDLFLENKSVEQSYAAVSPMDEMMALFGAVGDKPVNSVPARAVLPKLFDSTGAFVNAALDEIYEGRAEDVIELRREDGLLSLNAPDDLLHRLSDLPRSYLAERRQGDSISLALTFDRELAARKLDEARKHTQTGWPEIGFVSDVHPIVDWLVDKVLMRLGRQEAPVLVAAVDEPVFLVQGIWCNKLGQPTVVEWMAVTGLPGDPAVAPMEQALAAAKVGPAMVNPAQDRPLDKLQALVPEAIRAARAHLADRRAAWDALIAEQLQATRERLDRFAGQATLFDSLPAPIRTKQVERINQTVDEEQDRANRLATDGEPLLRLIAVLDRNSQERAA